MSHYLTNNKITLRAVEPSDADFMYEVENDTEAWVYSDTVAPLSRRILREYALNYEADPFSARQLRMIATDPEGQQIGITDLYEISPLHRNAFVGFYILPQFRRKGLGVDLLNMLADYASGFLGIKMLGARIPESNIPSVEVFRKAGFTKSGCLPDWLSQKDGKRESLFIFTLAL